MGIFSRGDAVINGNRAGIWRPPVYALLASLIILAAVLASHFTHNHHAQKFAVAVSHFMKMRRLFSSVNINRTLNSVADLPSIN